MKGIVSAVMVAGGTLLLSLPVSAQLQNDPNMSHFYMARQQIQILDDAPVIYDKRTMPAQMQQQGALPRGPAPLPRAGFNSYTSSMPASMSSSLPQVVNGVPKKIPMSAPRVNPNMGKAGAYKPKAAPKPAGPVTAKTYAPYKGYGGNPAPVAQTTQSYAGGGNYNSSTAVRGSLLHWKRTR